jgi:hypothetical protein
MSLYFKGPTNRPKLSSRLSIFLASADRFATRSNSDLKNSLDQAT